MWRFRPKAQLDFDVDGEVVVGYVISVSDSDSIKIVFPYKHKMYRWKCKLDCIDLPVYRSSDHIEKLSGRITRDALRDMLLNKNVRVTCGKFDIDNKLLVDIHIDGESIIDWLVNNQYINTV